MSTTLFFLVPIGMLAAAWSLCFVGCVLNTHGTGMPYSNNILAETDLVAYWPLGDLNGSTVAGDLSGKGHNGTYTIPPPYPSGAQAVPFSSPIANPTLTLQRTSLVPGDAGGLSVGDKNLVAASVDFEGGYVSIPWSMQSSPSLDQFTLEAWIKPHWSGSGSWRVVFSAFVNNTGFRLFINDQNQWQVVIGTGPGNMTSSPNTMVPIVPSSTTPTYVALTCDMTGVMSLWVNPQSVGDSDTPTPPPANWTSGTPTGYVPADPSQLTAIFIAAGDNDQPLRTPTANPDGAPEYPFQGWIQSVALYSGVLSANDILDHFINGSG